MRITSAQHDEIARIILRPNPDDQRSPLDVSTSIETIVWPEGYNLPFNAIAVRVFWNTASELDDGGCPLNWTRTVIVDDDGQTLYWSPIR